MATQTQQKIENEISIEDKLKSLYELQEFILKLMK